MKKQIIIGFTILFIIVLIIGFLFFRNNNLKPFFLEDKYYGDNAVNEIGIDEINKLIDNKDSFVVFVYQPMCIASSDFESVLNDFFLSKKISIYKIAFSDIKDTKIGEKIKYYPSFIIYNKGKIVDFLESDKDEDTVFYTSSEGFEKWFGKYVKLKEVENDNNVVLENGDDENQILESINIENVIREDNKVNIYFFWGDGCPHCEEEKKFFESIKNNYGEYYNLYAFETWYNEENEKLLYTFADAVNRKVTGVPFTIIGDKTFSGFGEKNKQEFINAIESQHVNGYDVYFDKLKNNN